MGVSVSRVRDNTARAGSLDTALQAHLFSIEKYLSISVVYPSSLLRGIPSVGPDANWRADLAEPVVLETILIESLNESRRIIL